ncbi:uncharacterized protein LOC141829373 [Curcuma longa]|uniref:uncharacterized protein LOC141829373 n=1 Tax=Curcuma longa TaxID=136217 RepID=UPI003D9DBA88
MGWCNHCEECPIYKDRDGIYVCCTLCGRILEQNIYVSRLTFAKGSSGRNGNIIKILRHEYSTSNLRTLKKGRYAINYLVNCLHMRMYGEDNIIDDAHEFYQMVVDKHFTKGRKISHVAAACLYLSCRLRKLNYLLTHFCEYLEINVFVLGAMFLQLCKTLDLLEHPNVQKIVDPGLFIHRFTKRLLGKKDDSVSEMALRLVASMRIDWAQRKRKPNGLCGAALYVSVHSHGLNCSKSDIVSAVHIREATLNRWLIEFDNSLFDDVFGNSTNGGSCDVNKTPYVGHVEVKASKKSKELVSADSEDDESDHFAFSDIDDDEEIKERLAEEAKNMTPAQTPLEATRHLLKRKTFNPKINYEVLETLFASEQDSAKKQKVESDASDPHETPDENDDHADDPDNKDGDRFGASENDSDEDFDYGDEDYGYEDDF